MFTPGHVWVVVALGLVMEYVAIAADDYMMTRYGDPTNHVVLVVSLIAGALLASAGWMAWIIAQGFTLP